MGIEVSSKVLNPYLTFMKACYRSINLGVDRGSTKV